MEILDFKGKKLNDLNIGQLDFLYQNSYLNDIFYLGRKFELENKRFDVKNLKQFEPNVLSIVENIEKFELTKDIKYFNKALPYFEILYKKVVDNFDDFISDINLIKDFTSLYYASVVIVKYIKNFGIKDYAYDLWCRSLVRDVNAEILNKDYVWQTQNIHALILPFVENGMYDEAIQAYELFQKSKYFKKLTPYYESKQRIIYYKTDIALKIKNFKLMDNYFEELLQLLYDNKKHIYSLSALSSFKLSEIFLMHYRKESNLEFKKRSNIFIKNGFCNFRYDSISKIPDLNKDDLLQYFDIEYFREPILRLMYYIRSVYA